MEREEQFKAAYKHAKEILVYYRKLDIREDCGTISIQAQIDRYENGDRSDALLDGMESIS